MLTPYFLAEWPEIEHCPVINVLNHFSYQVNWQSITLFIINQQFLEPVLYVFLCHEEVYLTGLQRNEDKN